MLTSEVMFEELILSKLSGLFDSLYLTSGRCELFNISSVRPVLERVTCGTAG